MKTIQDINIEIMENRLLQARIIGMYSAHLHPSLPMSPHIAVEMLSLTLELKKALLKFINLQTEYQAILHQT